jgi:mono/diheme cytochrome c family protein
MSLRPGEWLVLAGSGVIAAFALLVGVLIYLKPPPVQYRYLEDARTQAGEAVYRRQGCGSCHKVFENGAKVGPALDGVGARRSAAWLNEFLRQHAYLKDERRLAALTAYLQALR